ncbi:MAG: hypothetical protein AB3N14_09680 [Flavobacteriaceae bacterium]
MKRIYWLLLLVLVLLIIGITQMPKMYSAPNADINEKDSIPQKRQLRRSFFQKREVLIIYGADNPALAVKYESLLDEFTNRPEEDSRRRITYAFKEASEVTEKELKENVLYLLGSAKGNSLLETFTQNIPIKINETAIDIDGTSYEDQDALISIGFYPNAMNDTLPVSLLSGNDEEKVFDLFQKRISEGSRFVFRQNLDYEIYQDGKRLILGDFDEEWGLDKETYFDFSTGEKLLYSSENFDFISYPGVELPTPVKGLAEDIETTLGQILNFLEKKEEELPRIPYYIYKSVEQKGLMLGNTDQAHHNSADKSVHTVINKAYKDNFVEKENALIIELLLGSAASEPLDRGLPLYFSDQWQGKGYKYWAARLFESGNMLSLEALFDKELMELESPLIFNATSAALVAFLIEHWGKEAFLNRYKNWTPSERELKLLDPEWQTHLKELASLFPKKSRKAAPLTYLKGFNFAHEGYSIYNGYTGSKAIPALNKMAALGSNALAIIPYGSIWEKNKPNPYRTSHGPGGENDEGVVHTAFTARELGMTTLLKPQLWGGGTWPGEVEMLTEEDWQLFFNYYYKWIRHYAFLAEIHEIDALSVGVEFAKATLMKEAQWRKMFRGIKGLYQGKLTYSANWGTEFEQVGFWDELDFIGLNCYYPLSKNDQPSKAELKANFEKVKAKIEIVYQKFNKPIVFTEIGFRSIDAPWKSPHAEGDDSFNEHHQQLCYEVVFEGIENQEWCQGILWWKFPSYLEYRGKENSAFTPNYKKAELTVKEWFTAKLP